MGKSAKSKPPRFSDTISAFCQSMEDAKMNYSWCRDEVNRLDKLTQDYLHKLELGSLDYRDRAKVATAIARCRRQRRGCKDTAETLEPLIQFLDSERGKNLMNLMREVLGKTRKVEKNMENRTYIPRVLTEEEMQR